VSAGAAVAAARPRTTAPSGMSGDQADSILHTCAAICDSEEHMVASKMLNVFFSLSESAAPIADAFEIGERPCPHKSPRETRSEALGAVMHTLQCMRPGGWRPWSTVDVAVAERHMEAEENVVIYAKARAELRERAAADSGATAAALAEAEDALARADRRRRYLQLQTRCSARENDLRMRMMRADGISKKRELTASLLAARDEDERAQRALGSRDYDLISNLRYNLKSKPSHRCVAICVERIRSFVAYHSFKLSCIARMGDAIEGRAAERIHRIGRIARSAKECAHSCADWLLFFSSDGHPQSKRTIMHALCDMFAELSMWACAEKVAARREVAAGLAAVGYACVARSFSFAIECEAGGAQPPPNPLGDLVAQMCARTERWAPRGGDVDQSIRRAVAAVCTDNMYRAVPRVMNPELLRLDLSLPTFEFCVEKLNESAIVPTNDLIALCASMLERVFTSPSDSMLDRFCIAVRIAGNSWAPFARDTLLSLMYLPPTQCARVFDGDAPLAEAMFGKQWMSRLQDADMTILYARFVRLGLVAPVAAALRHRLFSFPLLLSEATRNIESPQVHRIIQAIPMLSERLADKHVHTPIPPSQGGSAKRIRV
jgi:hypothetical protein